ncbi:VanZ family protein [Agrococcus sp. TF02-5]|nr:VanZ family protein [Agrococcus sp. TF02-05]MBO1769108.1 VanZ family protein [Agrococcus sp. TF02-05]
MVLVIGDWLRVYVGTGWFGYGWIEVAANVALFAPLGALLSITLGQRRRSMALALALSVCAELVQLALPERDASLRDVAANAAGAALGIAAVWRVPPHRRRAHRRLRNDPRLAP